MKKVGLFFIVVVSVAAMLSGCVPSNKNLKPVDKKRQDEVWATRQLEMKQMDNWLVSGRVSVKMPEKRNTATFVWWRKRDKYGIIFKGALGTVVANIEGDNTGAKMELRDGRLLADKNLDDLMEQLTGRSLPITHLFSWVLGIPAPGKVFNVTLDNWGNPKELSQAGWVVQYDGYQGLGTRLLPVNVRINSGSVMLHLLIDGWELK